ncbi:MAG: DUF1573 domain-containing protein [Bacteroidales bacterium]
MKRIFYLFGILMLLTVVLQAQSIAPNMSFNETTHDFGNIKEADGTVKHKFVFTNTGSSPLIIKNVNASCGCTSPSWSKAPILPGAQGYVETTFDPRNRPGNFSKTITVDSNGEPSRQILTITGDVLAREKSLEELYPVAFGPVRTKSNHVTFGNLFNGDVKTQDIEFVNTSGEPVKVAFSNLPKHLEVSGIPSMVSPKQKFAAKFTFNTNLSNDWDFVRDIVYMEANGQRVKNYLNISAVIREDFSKLTPAEKANAPVATFDNLKFNYGKIKEGEVVENEFVLKNTGKSNLIIRKVKASCGCTAVNPEKNVIAPGQSTTIKAVFNSKGRRGAQRKSVRVITNDPANSSLVLWIEGVVE